MPTARPPRRRSPRPRAAPAPERQDREGQQEVEEHHRPERVAETPCSQRVTTAIPGDAAGVPGGEVLREGEVAPDRVIARQSSPRLSNVAIGEHVLQPKTATQDRHGEEQRSDAGVDRARPRSTARRSSQFHTGVMRHREVPRHDGVHRDRERNDRPPPSPDAGLEHRHCCARAAPARARRRAPERCPRRRWQRSRRMRQVRAPSAARGRGVPMRYAEIATSPRPAASGSSAQAAAVRAAAAVVEHPRRGPGGGCGKRPPTHSANTVMASAQRVTGRRHSAPVTRRIAEISVPAWLMPIQNTKVAS